MAQARPAKWGQERRLEFIDFRLYWHGKVNRSDLVNFFGVSIPQASLDLARYQELAPQNAVYDSTEKAYVASENFSPAITARDAMTYLNQVLAIELGVLQPNSVFATPPPPVAAVNPPTRTVNPVTLRRVLQAIRSRTMLHVEYQSMSRTEPSKRTLSPHAIAFDGFRWHIRAFCHERKEFLDFVFARILTIMLGDRSPVDPSTDLAWCRELHAVVVPHPALSAGQKRAIELDYGMEDGRLLLKAREALLWYVLQHLGLLYEPGHSGASDQVVLANRGDLTAFFRSHGLETDENAV